MKAENRFGLQSLAAFNIFSGFKSVSILIFFLTPKLQGKCD